eukprot:4561670-Karenia_brevis.AAC.1
MSSHKQTCSESNPCLRDNNRLQKDGLQSSESNDLSRHDGFSMRVVMHGQHIMWRPHSIPHSIACDNHDIISACHDGCNPVCKCHNIGCCLMCHPVPSAAPRYLPINHKNLCVGPLGDCGASARVGRPVV